MHNHSPLDGQQRFVAPSVDAKLPSTMDVDTSHPPESQWKQAWQALRSNCIFWFSAILLLLVLVVVFFPGLFSSVDPRSASFSDSLGNTECWHFFVFSKQ